MDDRADFVDGGGVPGPPLALGYLIKRFQVGLRAIKDDHLRAFGITATQYGVLSVLSRVEGVSTAELARYFRVTPQAMSQQLAGLERRGLVARQADPRHQKIMRLRLTAAGRQLQRASEAVVSQAEDEVLRALSTEERRTLLTTLWKVCETMGMLDQPAGAPASDPPAQATAQPPTASAPERSAGDLRPLR